MLVCAGLASFEAPSVCGVALVRVTVPGFVKREAFGRFPMFGF